MTRLINADDMIKSLMDMTFYDDEWSTIHDYEDRLAIVKSFVDPVPTVDAIPFKWTPCSERLPEETGTYLVTINYHGNTYVSMDNFSPSGWELTGWTGLATRLAWAKVPEPYKGETE